MSNNNGPYAEKKTMNPLNHFKETPKKSVGAVIRTSVITGVFVVIPIFLSLWAAWSLYSFLTDWAVPFSQNIADNTPEWISPFVAKQVVRVASLLVVALCLFLIGLLTKITIGRRLLRLAESIMLKLPIISFVYTTCKQIGDALWSSQKGNMFQKVVLFEYPRKGSYSVGFLTSEVGEDFEISKRLGKTMVSVFMPTTPNPTSGFLMYIPKDECQILDMSVSEAMRLIVSCGAVLPGTPENTNEENE
ncbi:MAG: DUF502 domain-containing protein [Lentisphaeria bacterium]|nr:DUF502 domain-containing protein [Lentisphaeria bacterium]